MKPAWLILPVALVFAGPIAGEEGDPAPIFENWRAWASDRQIETGQIAVLRNGRMLGRDAIGDATGPVDFASLSKAVTAHCIAEIVALGEAKWEDTVGRWLPETQLPLSSIRLDALMTHSSGLTPDSTQGWMPDLRGDGPPAYEAVVERIETRALGPGAFEYNNENYGVLGAVISAISGAPYAETCAVEGLSLSPTYGRFAAWGGWSGDLADFGRFLWDAFGDADPTDQPAVRAYADALRYGQGVVWRSWRGGYNVWHFGALCFADGDAFFTHAVLFANGVSVVSHVEGCPAEDWFFSLDQAIYTGAFKQ